ncbi:MAG: Gfo/Idh/MocA family oxidoreductase [Planctomycetes bacterium]|nr:Gfo/Idh/MocA family oxidoreductase [Planctomycetota bacterium]
MVRIGIIGIGGFAAQHWWALEEVQRSEACKIVAAAVIDPEYHTARLEELRGRGVRIFHCAEAMYDAMRGQMDAVTIPTPIHTHAELMISAVQSGYHVYLEKPPAATIQEVDEMIAAAKRTGRICAVGFQAMWSQSMSLLKLRISEGALGQVQRIACSAGWIRKDDYYCRADWAGRLRLGDSWVLDGSANNPLSHEIANMLYLASPRCRTLGSPAAVRAELYAAHEIEGEDTAAIEIVTNEGPRCYLLGTLCADDAFDPEISILASEGTAYRSSNGRVCIRYNDGRLEEPAPDDGRQDVEKFENFVAAAAANDTGLLRCHLEMCRPFTLAINGAFESARQVRRIPPEYLRITGEGPGRKTVIQGIDSAVPRAASQCRLFSDLQLPWAKRTATFDLTGYKRFPQRFDLGGPIQVPSIDELSPG